eukprot:gene9640-1844_t
MEEEYQVDELVFSLGKSNETVQAKILEVKKEGSNTLYFVHYDGHNKRYDEWVTSDRLSKKGFGNTKIVDTRRKTKTEDDPDYLTNLNFVSEKIKKVLRRDRSFIQQEGKLYSLPNEVTVNTIFSNFLTKKKNHKQLDFFKIVIDGMKKYFSVLAPKNFLYKNERIQFTENVEKNELNPLEFYGVEHLLRFLVKLPKILETQVFNHTNDKITSVLSEVLDFIEKNHI